MDTTVHTAGDIVDSRPSPPSEPKFEKRKSRYGRLKKDLWLYILLLPGLVYFLIFKYLPMWGVVIAFQNYSPFLGVFDSPWVGFEHFRNFFSNPDFVRLLRNTLILAVYDLVFFFPAPIIAALLLNEVRVGIFKRAVQTMIYVPHFIS